VRRFPRVLRSPRWRAGWRRQGPSMSGGGSVFRYCRRVTSCFMQGRPTREHAARYALSAPPSRPRHPPADQSMIRKSGYRFSEKDHARTKIQSEMAIQRKAIAL
jgi:hypothetical protein